MFRYLIPLLLINTCYESLGNPINSTDLPNSLTALAESCKNEFLSNQIKSRIKDCSIPKVNQFKCLIFFDINNQLCSLSNLVLTDDNAAKINEDQNVNTLCMSAKTWVFTNLTEYPDFKPTADRVLKHPVTCGKLCGVEELTSENANFYCKYLSWGSEILRIHMTPTTTKIISPNEEAPLSENAVVPKAAESSLVSNESGDVQIKNSAEILKQTPPATKTTPKMEIPADTEVKSEGTSTNRQATAESNSDKVENVDVTAPKSIETSAALPEKVSTNDHIDRSSDQVLANPAELKDEHSEVNTNNEVANKENVLEIPRDNNAGDDYQGNDVDSEEGKEGLGDNVGGDDGDDPIIGDDIKTDLEQTKIEDSHPNNMERIPYSNGAGLGKELYPNAIQDRYAEDEEHFFPLFVTIVIMVVLMYVIYHNKNKVAKLFFGLMLEGRQSGRRRNSRGHAYRRLDTLEQAMSTNTSAPPSKIIY